jgi:hypothetical protein
MVIETLLEWAKTPGGVEDIRQAAQTFRVPAIYADDGVAFAIEASSLARVLRDVSPQAITVPLGLEEPAPMGYIHVVFFEGETLTLRTIPGAQVLS